MSAVNAPELTSDRLFLVAVSPATADAAASGNLSELARHLRVRIPPDWPPRIDDDGQMAREGFAFVRDLLAKDPSVVGWWGWFVLARGSDPRLIGSVGTKGPPDSNGVVEVSYGIIASEQRKGHATEATLALIQWASRDSRTRRIVAETYPHLAASIGVMKKCGLSPCGDGSEPGTIRYGSGIDNLQHVRVLRAPDSKLSRTATR